MQCGLPVGEWKTIDTFKVLAAFGQYQPIAHQYKLIFLGETVVTKYDLQFFSFPYNFIFLKYLKLNKYTFNTHGKI